MMSPIILVTLFFVGAICIALISSIWRTRERQEMEIEHQRHLATLRATLRPIIRHDQEQASPTLAPTDPPQS